MKTIKQFPHLAVLFGVLAVATAAILVFNVPQWVNYIFAIFWLIIGLLGLYQGFKK